MRSFKVLEIHQNNLLWSKNCNHMSFAMKLPSQRRQSTAVPITSPNITENIRGKGSSHWNRCSLGNTTNGPFIPLNDFAAVMAEIGQ